MRRLSTSALQALLWTALASAAVTSLPRQANSQSGPVSLDVCNGSPPAGHSVSSDITFCEDFGRVGCSLPPSLDKWAYKHVFYTACKGHDMCYRYGWQTYGKTRTECDEAFHADMHDLCTNPDEEWYYDLLVISSIPFCLSQAEIFYVAVLNFGDPSFRRENGSCCPYMTRVTWQQPASFVFTVETVLPTKEPCKTAWLTQTLPKPKPAPVRSDAALLLLVLH